MTKNKIKIKLLACINTFDNIYVYRIGIRCVYTCGGARAARWRVVGGESKYANPAAQ